MMSESSKRHSKFLSLIFILKFHALLEKHGVDESVYSSPMHMQFHPQPSKENKEAKILWDTHAP